MKPGVAFFLPFLTPSACFCVFAFASPEGSVWVFVCLPNYISLPIQLWDVLQRRILLSHLLFTKALWERYSGSLHLQMGWVTRWNVYGAFVLTAVRRRRRGGQMSANKCSPRPLCRSAQSGQRRKSCTIALCWGHLFCAEWEEGIAVGLGKASGGGGSCIVISCLLSRIGSGSHSCENMILNSICKQCIVSAYDLYIFCIL